jgi:predicted site-specific integrase-resolvase
VSIEVKAAVAAGERLVGTAEAAEILQVKQNTVAVWALRGRMPQPKIMVGQARYWSCEDVFAMSRQPKTRPRSDRT